MSSRPLFYLIDGHAVAYRQFFALPVGSFSTRAGEPTNAIYGFARTLLDIMLKERPQYLAVSFDMGLSGRETLYEAYKGTREKMPSELDGQIERIGHLVEAFNIPVLAKAGYEADDVMGTVVQQMESADVDVRIVTGDRDILQLLNDHVTVQIPSRSGPDTVYDVAMFRETYGLEPRQLVDLKALMGDTSDNIPGVKGIGEKTATKLLQDYGDLDGVYAHIGEIKGSLQQKLIEGKESAYLSRELAAIRRDVPITLELPACVTHEYDVSRVAELFRELEFRSLADRLPVGGAAASGEQLVLFDVPAEALADTLPETIVETVTVRDRAALETMVKALNAAQAISFDVESTSTDQMIAQLVGISLATNGDSAYYIPVGHQSGDQLPLEVVLDALRAPLTNPQIPKYAHNADYDLVMMQRYGIDVQPITFDTMVAEWVRNPSSKFLGLKNLARQELGVHMTEITDLIGTGKKQVTMDTLPVEQVAPYAAADAAVTHRLVDFLRPELEKNALLELFESFEMPLVPVIADMERAGVLLDTAFLSELGGRMAAQLAELEEQIIGHSGGYGKFNINSPKQLNDVLFGKLGLSVAGLRKTSHGYSTAADVLEDLKGQHPIIDYILQYREISKLKGTYVDALPALINPDTGRVHTNYNQTGTTTGRISSNNPNLQNIPIRSDLGREVRRAFITPPGTVLLGVDYSQVELRVLAHVSQEPTLLEAFRLGQDIHAATAAIVYGVPLEQVTSKQRYFAKRVNFGLLYGMGAFRLARDSDLTLTEAELFIKTYFERLPRVQRYLEGTKQLARQQGYLTTLFGRRRYFPILHNVTQRSNMIAVRQAEREAINMPIQGTAADIMKKAMIELHSELARRKLGARMILQVHDELVFEVPEPQLDETHALVINIMEGACELDAPLRANAQYGSNWRDMDGLAHN